MNSWDEDSRDGMEDQKERKEKVGKKVEPVTRPRGDDWAERKYICRSDSEKFKAVS